MKKIGILFISFLFLSCAEDSPNQDPQEVVMTGYKIDHNSSPGYHFITIGNLANNKLFSETYENILNGVSQGTTTEQRYFYNTDGTLDHYKRKSANGNDQTIYLHYDASQNLIGAELMVDTNSNAINYRFVHNPNNIVFFERIGGSYDDPNADISNRYILQFNDNDDVISAGRDNDLDGTADQINTFQYANDNLISASFWDGNVENFNYSNIVDNHLYLWENSIGRKNRRIFAGECYVTLFSSYFLPNLSISKNILLEDANAATFQVLPNLFYEFKTQNYDQSVTTTQYFFQ